MFFFLSAKVDIEGVKTTLKFEGGENILLNILEIIGNTNNFQFLCKLMKLMLF